MAKNQVGVGFAFGARDRGLANAATKVAGSFGVITGAITGLNERVKKNFSDLKSQLVSIKDAMPANLTTSYEAQLVAADKAGRQLAANLGYGSKQMGQFAGQATSMGIALNRSTEEAGKAIFAWDRGSDVLKTIGIDSKETALKLGDVFGVDTTKFVFTLKEMKSSLGFNDDAIRKLTSSTVAWGQQSGDVGKALNSMQDQVNMLQKRAHAFGRTLSGDELAQWAESSNQAKQLLFALGNNAEKAESTVQSLNEQFLETGRNMGKMFAGTADDLTTWQQHFAIAGVDIENQFDLMRQGPLGFIKGMSGMVKNAGGFANMTGEQMNFIKRQMEEALGPDVSDQLFNVFKQGDDAVEAMIKKLPKATEDLGKLAKAGFRTGRTLSESLQLAGDQFMHMLRAQRMVSVETGQVDKKGRKLTKQVSIGTKYVMDAQKSYKELGAQLIKLSKGNGPLSTVASKLMDIQIIGYAGLLPESMRGYVPVFETLGKEFGPILTGLGQMVPLLTLIVSPLGLMVGLIGGLVFWFMSARREGDTFTDTLRTMRGQAGGFFYDMEEWMVGKFPQYAKTIHLIMSGLSFAVNTVLGLISLVGSSFGTVLEFIESSLNSEVNSFADIGETIAGIWKYDVVDPIKYYFQNLWTDIRVTATTLFEDLKTLVKTAVDYMGGILSGAVDTFEAPFKVIDGWADKLFRNSIDTDMKESFALATRHADKFAGNMSSSMSSATAPLAGLTGNVSVSANGAAVTKLPPPIRPSASVSADARDAGLVAAVNSPHWYARYEAVFSQRMESLERTIASMQPSGAARAPPKPKGGNRTPKRLDLGLNKYTATDTVGFPTSEE